jgi:hypothetical protein
MLGGLGGALPTGNSASLLSGVLNAGGGGVSGLYPGGPSTGSFLAMQNGLNTINSGTSNSLLSGALSAGPTGAANNCNNLENF